MPKYLISWTEEDWYKVEIEADSWEEAKEKFWTHDFDREDIVHTGTEIQDSLEIEEITVS